MGEMTPATQRRLLRVLQEGEIRRVGGGWLFRRDLYYRLNVFPIPGNVRELENEIERALALVDDGEPIGLAHLSPRLTEGAGDAAGAPTTLNEAIDQLSGGALICFLPLAGVLSGALRESRSRPNRSSQP